MRITTSMTGSPTQLIYTRVGINLIEQLLKEDKNWEVKVSMNKMRKDSRFPQEPTRRHQVSISKPVISVTYRRFSPVEEGEKYVQSILDVKLYSIPLNAKNIIDLGLTPVDKAVEKEKIAEMVNKLDEKNRDAIWRTVR